MSLLTKIISVAIIVCLCLSGCKGDGHLRGEVSSSSDGKTYFAVLDDAEGFCSAITLDGVAWEHSIGVYTEIQPGDHAIDCGKTSGDDIYFIVPPGVRFGFDYWGP